LQDRIARLPSENYVPSAATPLIDAAYKTIQAVADSVKDEETKVVICIQTDGQENSSTEHTWADLNALIKEKTALGWQFNFMGAGIDAYQQSAQMGIAAAATLSYDKHSPAATMSAFRAAASNTSQYASGQASNTNYSLAQKHAAGDRFHKQKSSFRSHARPAVGASQDEGS
jgi:hypothetical protein